MKGDDYASFCSSCEKNVYNLSMLTRAEANELIQAKEGSLCVQLYRRFDGTVLTGDCPKGLQGIKRHYLKTRAKFITAMIAVAGLLGLSLPSCQQSTTAGIPAQVDTTHRTQSNPSPAR
jgi:hypothetical protein